MENESKFFILKCHSCLKLLPNRPFSSLSVLLVHIKSIPVSIPPLLWCFSAENQWKIWFLALLIIHILENQWKTAFCVLIRAYLNIYICVLYHSRSGFYCVCVCTSNLEYANLESLCLSNRGRWSLKHHALTSNWTTELLWFSLFVWSVFVL